MKTKEEYDQHLLQFYADTFREFALKNGLSSGRYQNNEAEGFANQALMQYGSAINNGIAVELISEIQATSQTTQDALYNYPSMFWKTRDGKETLSKLINDEARNKASFFIEELREGKSWNIDLLEETLKNIINVAKKVSYKDMTLGHSMVQIFQGEIKNATEFFSKNLEIVKPGTNIDGYLDTFKHSLLKVYKEEVSKNENIAAYSELQQVLHMSIKDISTSLEYSKKISNKM